MAHPLQPRLAKEEWTGKAIVVDPINQVFVSSFPHNTSENLTISQFFVTFSTKTGKKGCKLSICDKFVQDPVARFQLNEFLLRGQAGFRKKH